MKNNTGFTLIEVMIALLVFTIGLLGIMGISSITIRSATDNERWNGARMIATSHAERLSSIPLATLHTMPATEGPSIETYNSAPYSVQWWLVKTGSTSQPIVISVQVGYSSSPLHDPVTISTIRSFTL